MIDESTRKVISGSDSSKFALFSNLKFDEFSVPPNFVPVSSILKTDTVLMILIHGTGTIFADPGIPDCLTFGDGCNVFLVLYLQSRFG